MGKAAEKIQSVTLAGLKERGWTDGAGKRFLGAPDALVPNPNYRSGPRMRLYELPRVERTEQSQEWRTWRDQTKARREKASVRQTERMSASRAALTAQINAVEIRIPRLPQKKLFGVAVDNRNAQADWHAAERGHFDHADASVCSADTATLQRWAVNYLRHAETYYDWLLDSVTGRVGVTEARLLIRERVLDAIAGQYPYLAAECARQKAQR
ncbi:MAG: hypothetical protein K0U84_16450 [Actinomycetia bacterium]|nr:hypothetical protein [Actinomycetes bacterium]